MHLQETTFGKKPLFTYNYGGHVLLCVSEQSAYLGKIQEKRIIAPH